MGRSSQTSSGNVDFDRLAGARVGIVGDLVADLYVSGQSDRVSREAPVLIVRHEREWLRPGGAANVAANVAALGATATLVGLIGEDEPGRRLMATLREADTAGPANGKVNCEHLVNTARETITKTRFLAGAKLTSRQQVLRLDRAPKGKPDADMLASLCERLKEVDPHVDAWVISDYGYGMFDDAICEALRSISNGKPVVVDSRWDLARFTGTGVLKPNEEEAHTAALALGIDAGGGDIGELALALADRLEAQAMLVTLGNKGMVLAENGRSELIRAVGTEEIVDLTGAGDSVSATLATALASGSSTLDAARLANHAGSIVVMKEGAATASPEELKASIARAESAA